MWTRAPSALTHIQHKQHLAVSQTEIVSRHVTVIIMALAILSDLQGTRGLGLGALAFAGTTPRLALGITLKRHFVTRKNSKVNLRCVRRYRRPVPRCRGVELEVQVADEGPDARRSHQSLSLHSPSPAAEGKGTTIAEGAVVPRRQDSYGRGCISKHLTRTSGPLSHDRPIDRTSGPSRSARCGCSVDFTTWTSQAPTS